MQFCGIHLPDGYDGVVGQKLDPGGLKGHWTVKNYNSLVYSFVAGVV